MKKIEYLIPLLLFAFACNKTVVLESPVKLEEPLTTKSYLDKAAVSNYEVTSSDIQDYLQVRQTNARQQGKELFVRSITPIVGASGTITSYIINYEKGCEILSGDKRTSPVLAYSESENIDNNQLPQPAKDWLHDLNKDIEDYKNNTLGILSEKELPNVAFWDRLVPQRFDPVPAIPADYPPGHWQIVNSESQIVNDTIVGPLVAVKWGQGSPYNTYCPLVQQEYDPLRSPAGCVAVAGAQLLYHFHYSLGVPATAPSSGSVSGHVYPSHDDTQSFSNESSTIWDQMLSQPSTAAPLIGSIGKEIDTNYATVFQVQNGVVTDLQSGATAASFLNYIYYEYNFAYSWKALTQASDTTLVIGSINGDSPVFVGAGSQDEHHAHAFLIDAWKRSRYQYTYTYVYVCDDPYLQQYLNLPPATIVRYSSPTLYFAMNWGYEGTYDSLWFTPLGVWNPGGISYDGVRHLHYNFFVRQ